MALIKTFLSLLFSLIGLIWQLFYISQQYFEYQAASQIYFHKLTEIPIPRLTLTFSEVVALPSDVSWTDATYIGREWYLSYKYAAEPDQIFANCSNIARSGAGRTNCGAIIKSVTNNPVYTVNYNDNLDTLERHLLTRWSALYTIALNSSLLFENSSMMYVLFIPNNVNAFSEEDNNCQLRLRKNYDSYFGLSYNYVKISRLQPPYDTNCFDYKTAGLHSHAHCYENCVFFAANSNNIISDITLTRHGLDYQPIESMVINYSCSMDTRETNETNRIQCDLKLRSQCQLVCKQEDCTKEIYDVKIEDLWYTENLNGNLTIDIEVYAPTSVSTIIEYVAKISPIDYITYVLSCISFWLGVSPLDSLMQFDLERMKRTMARIVSKVLLPNSCLDNDKHRVVRVQKAKSTTHLPCTHCVCKRTVMQNTALKYQIEALRKDVSMLQAKLK